MGFASRKPHRCKVKRFNKYTRRAWWYRQQESERRRQQNKSGESRQQQWSVFDTTDDTKYREILGVEVGMSEKEIQYIWRQKALLYHPDRNPDRQQWTTEMMQKINEAYERVQLNAR